MLAGAFGRGSKCPNQEHQPCKRNLEIHLESALTESRPEIEAANEAELAHWEPALSRVEAYLRAWRIGNSDRVRECAREIVDSARHRGGENPTRTAIEE